jgi:hypothetical protein
MTVSARFQTSVFSSPCPLEQAVPGCVITVPPNSEQTTIISPMEYAPINKVRDVSEILLLEKHIPVAQQVSTTLQDPWHKEYIFYDL